MRVWVKLFRSTLKNRLIRVILVSRKWSKYYWEVEKEIGFWSQRDRFETIICKFFYLRKNFFAKPFVTSKKKEYIVGSCWWYSGRAWTFVSAQLYKLMHLWNVRLSSGTTRTNFVWKLGQHETLSLSTEELLG